MKNLKRKSVITLASVTVLALSTQPAICWKKQNPANKPEFDRTQFMVINLNRGKNSSGYYLQESAKDCRLLMIKLDKAARQIEQVDSAYAKTHGHPDDRYLRSARERIATARATAATLEQQLTASSDELKTSIQQILLAGP